MFNWLTHLKVVLVLGVIFMGAIVPASYAATSVNLYDEAVVVSQNASQKEQNEAIEEAFRRLLVRVTGYEDVLAEPSIADKLDKGSRYLASFRFEASDVMFTNVLGENVPTKKMTMNFDKKSVDNLLVQLRLPVWGSKRPDVLIWMGDRFNGREHVLADSENSESAQLIKKYSDIRGVPYMLPLMDLTDTLDLSFSDIYGLFSSDIERASIRYLPDAILAGRMSGTPQKARADWMMIFKGERLRLPTVTGTLEEVIAVGMDLVAQRLSEQYALLLDPLMMGTVSIQINNITNLNQFAALEDYLETINVITQVTVRHFAENGVKVDLELSGDSAQLSDILQLDNLLVPVEEELLIDQLDNEVVYEWAGK